MKMPPVVRIVHEIPGRVRLQVELRRLFQADAARFVRELTDEPGVREVRLNVHCRSVIVAFEPGSWTTQGLAQRIGTFVGTDVQVVAGPSGNGHAGRRPWQGIEAGDARQAVRLGWQRIQEAARNWTGGWPWGEGEWESPGSAPRPPGSRGERGREPAESAWHALTGQQVLRHWSCSAERGLLREEAERRLEKYGLNALAATEARPWWSILAEQFTGLPIALLLGSAAVSVATGGVADAAVILAVILINAGIGFVTESQTEVTVRSLLNVTPPPVRVIRSGNACSVPTEHIVPGDLLVLTPGLLVPADARVLDASRLTVDESALTGESMPVEKWNQALAGRDVPLRDRRNMVYRGTVVTGGSGLAVAVASGSRTEVGQIQTLVGDARPPETPTQRQLRTLGATLGILSGGICAGVFVLGLVRGYGLVEMLKSASSLAVAAVPEGLPMVATTTLALGVRGMRRQRVLVRRLDAIETLGAVQVFCLDKTGTLTLNRMRVVRATVGAVQATQSSPGDEPAGDDWQDPRFLARPEVDWLLKTAVLCSEVKRDKRQEGQLLGSPTETALFEFAQAAGLDVRAVRRQFPLLDTEYRTEQRGYMTTLHELGPGSHEQGPGSHEQGSGLHEQGPGLHEQGSGLHEQGSGQRLLAVKGRPTDVLELCGHWMRNGECQVLTETQRAAIRTENERLAGQALRVLALACAQGPDRQACYDQGLTWLGLVGIADPIRPGVAELIPRFHRAGVRTTMITGDQSATAYAIGRQLKLGGDGELQAIDSTRLTSIAPEVLTDLAQKVHVFSAVSPAHKLEIVQALQRAGIVVAMTGDGINDGPALKAADIGVAMGGEAATEVARMTADVVLQDDNLETMINAIRQGRGIYANIRHAIRYLLATNLSEIVVMTVSVASGLGEPLNPMQLLWINLVSDIFPVLALAVQPPEEDVLDQPPRDPHEPLVQWRDAGQLFQQSLLISAGTFASYAWGRWRYGDPARAGTLAFMSITGAQLFHMLTARSEQHSLFSRDRPPTNAALQWAFAGGVGLQLLTALVPPLRRLMRSTPLSPLDALVCLAGAAAPTLVIELGKHLRGPAAADDTDSTSDRRGGTSSRQAAPSDRQAATSNTRAATSDGRAATSARRDATGGGPLHLPGAVRDPDQEQQP